MGSWDGQHRASLVWVVVRLMKIVLKEKGGTLNCELEFSKQPR